LAAAPKLDRYNSHWESQEEAAIVWELSGLGKPSDQLIMASNNKLLAFTSNKMYCFDGEGSLLWEAKSTSGKMGNPVLCPNGSIITAGKGEIAETKANGVRGWNFIALPGGKDKEPQIAGNGNIIYLPLPYALYALDTNGRTLWTFTNWNNSDRFSTKTVKERTFMECAANEEAFYAIFADEKDDFRLIAIDRDGRHLWTYWLGELISASIATGKQGEIYVTATQKPKRTGTGKSSGSKLNQGRIYCFDCREGKQPQWQRLVKINGNLTKPVIADDRLYVSGGSNLYVLDTDSGEIILEHRLLNLSSPVAVDVVNERLYAGSSKGLLYAINSNGRLEWSCKLEGAIEQAPLLGPDGFIYVITQKGHLYKICAQGY